MPYIPEHQRRELDTMLSFVYTDGLTKGEVNYLLSRLVWKWVRSLGPESYDNLSNGHSVLGDAMAEWYRAVMGPYEEKKAAQNGTVYV